MLGMEFGDAKTILNISKRNDMAALFDNRPLSYLVNSVLFSLPAMFSLPRPFLFFIHRPSLDKGLPFRGTGLLLTTGHWICRDSLSAPFEWALEKEAWSCGRAKLKIR